MRGSSQTLVSPSSICSTRSVASGSSISGAVTGRSPKSSSPPAAAWWRSTAARSRSGPALERGLDARILDATALGFDGEFDAVFSNAVLHWITDPDAVLQEIRCALVPGGRLVAEFGGAGCVASIRDAFGTALSERGIDAEGANPWYFPTGDEYRTRLEANGFGVDMLSVFPRPTPLPSDVASWLEIFAQPFLATVPEDDRPDLVSEVRGLLEPALKTAGGVWVVDYVRLRTTATKLS